MVGEVSTGGGAKPALSDMKQDDQSPDLLQLLTLERLEQNLFRATSWDVGQGSVFGGQVLGQALTAATQTVTGRNAHSMHAYFLLPGDYRAPIVYDVERVRDGRSFSTRRVVAVQHGKTIFIMSVSFQVAEEGVDHQRDMPPVPAPENLPSKTELAEKIIDRIPEASRDFLLRKRPIEFRPVDPVDPLSSESHPPYRQIWMRSIASLPDALAVHQAVLAYASDFSLLGTALLPHGLSLLQNRVRAASLDHAMWFHRDFRADEWLLYALESPNAVNCRGLGQGSIFSQDGRLVATVIQEGLIRTG